jgi:hypothetical protein
VGDLPRLWKGGIARPLFGSAISIALDLPSLVSGRLKRAAIPRRCQHPGASLPELRNTPGDANSIAPASSVAVVTRASSGKTDWLNTATLVRVSSDWLRGERGHYANGRDPDERRGRCQAPEPYFDIIKITDSFEKILRIAVNRTAATGRDTTSEMTYARACQLSAAKFTASQPQQHLRNRWFA